MSETPVGPQVRDSPHGPVAPRPRYWGVTIGGRAPRVALVGNPNTGKTSLFNALTGYRRHAANYPGTTVEIGRGPMRGGARQIELIDLPGTYSLEAIAPDEALTADVVRGVAKDEPAPDALLVVTDASNLRRNLFLLTQLFETGLPVVVAANMMDIARRRGFALDAETLSAELGCAVVPVTATHGATIEPLRRSIEQAVAEGAAPRPRGWPPAPLNNPNVSAELQVEARYAWIDAALSKAVRRTAPVAPTWSERLDEIFTHRVLGLPLLLLVMFGIFQTLFTAAKPLMTGLEWTFGKITTWVSPLLPEGPLQSLVVDGLIGGVGGVVVFIPQIALLFALIAVLEDCGYLSRAAYMLDRTLRFAGLSGRSFIPLLSAFACAVPAILGARSIADRRERTLAIFLAPFMSCSARLPVYVLLISAFVPATALFGWLGLQGLVLFAMYLVGALAALPLAWIMRRTILHGPPPPFVLELPGYKVPRLAAVWQRVSGAVREFLVRAGTIILVVNLAVWALAYFPRSAAVESTVQTEAVAAGWDEQQTDRVIAARHLENSYLGRMGHAIEPVVRPLGWDWRIGMAVLASFPAREVVIGTLGTIFSLGGEVDESSDELKDALQTARRSDGHPLMTLPVALGVMVFFALCAQCSSTLVVMGRELRSWKWPVASFVTMTTMAYLAAWAVYATGSAFAR